ncbi:phosphohistidine phosphatase [Marmoricola sp. OAE513]|uniref:SixA phosphatase family protein n=1 Tax=Marmoricola sp. OAE513 TaxID=2817894 RepID=UPI001AE1732A
MSTRTLVVMRHAKAEPVAASDHDRELLPRGVADATAAGRWAASVGITPDHVVVSSAARTQGTWQAVADGAGWSAGAVTDKSLYSAGTDGALEILRTVPPDAATVLLVGHNPTMAYLVHLLDDGGADPAVFAEISAGYPTSALTVLEVSGPWESLDVGTARITGFHVGRG